VCLFYARGEQEERNIEKRKYEKEGNKKVGFPFCNSIMKIRR
jgi:hypothetical protein